MDRRSPQSREFTIRGKIRFAGVCLVVINCGIAAAAAYLFSNGMPLFGWFAISASAAATLAFAWLVPAVVLQPMYKLNLLAKSIERTPGMEVPNTTGAVETDDLLHTVSRASRQMTNFIDLMDQVSSGNTDAALGELEHSDRLSESFKRLVARVTDSIDAKAELELLRSEIDRLSSRLKSHDGKAFSQEVEYVELKPLAEALEDLVESRSHTLRVLHSSVGELKTLVGESRSRVGVALELNNRASQTVRSAVSQAADTQDASVVSLRTAFESVKAVDDIISDLAKTGSPGTDHAKSHKAIRKQFDAAIHKLREAAERSLAITHAAKLVQDLASRSNLIALNAHIHANGDAAEGLSNVSKEITSLSQRAEKASNAIAGISDSVVRDVNEAHASIQWITTEVGKLADRVIEREQLIAAAHDRLQPVAEFPTHADELLARQVKGHQELLKAVEDGLADVEEIAAELATAEATLPLFGELIKSLEELEPVQRKTLSPLADVAANGKAVLPVASGNGKGNLITLTESM